jgi:inorganic pyrophosphatase
MQDDFWEFLDKLIQDSEIVIDRPKGSRHPRHPEIIYPLDYGYLAKTQSPDGDGIDAWRGSLPQTRLETILITVDLGKRDSEIKLLLGCTPQEIQIAYKFHNTGAMRAALLTRQKEE